MNRFTKWRNRLTRLWPEIHLDLQNGQHIDEDLRVLSPGEKREIILLVKSQGIDEKDIMVEVILERQDAYREHQNMKSVKMGMVAESDEGIKEYRAQVTANTDGSYYFNCRLLPTHTDLFNSHEARLIKWLD